MAGHGGHKPDFLGDMGTGIPDNQSLLAILVIIGNGPPPLAVKERGVRIGFVGIKSGLDVKMNYCLIGYDRYVLFSHHCSD